MNRLVSVLLATLLVTMTSLTVLRLVREFHERPVVVYYCDTRDCEWAGDAR